MQKNKKVFNLPEDTKEKLVELNLSLSEQPDVDDEMNNLPRDITKIHSRELGKRYSYFVGQHCYAAGQLSLVDVEKTELVEKLRIAEAKLSKQLASKKLEKWRMTNEFFEDDLWRRIHLRLVRVEALRNVLATVVDGYEKKAACLSREMTRRAAETGLLGRDK